MSERSNPEGLNQQVFLHLYPSIVRALAACNIKLTDLLAAVPDGDRSAALLYKQTMPVDLWLRLSNEITQTVCQADQQKHFPIEFAKTFSFDFLSDFSLFVLSCDSLKEASMLLEWLPPFVCPVVRFEVIERSASVAFRLNYESPYDEPVAAWAMTETIVATMYQFWRPIAFQSSAPLKLCLRHMPHQRSHEMREFMGCDIEYGQEVNEFEISKQVYLARIQTANGLLKDIAQKKITTQTLPRIFKSSSRSPLHLRVNLTNEALNAAVVRDLVQLYENEPQLLGLGIDACSKCLGMSTRTLQRKLAQASTSHRKVNLEVRRALAKQHLGNPMLSYQQVAVMLGFKDLADFNAFFKLVEGVSPRIWRTRNKL
jgi:AraC-like DNA-binding protein